MSEQLKPGWRWENFERLRITVVTAPNGMEYELRPGDITHPRAQRLLDAMFAALTQRPAAQTERGGGGARVAGVRNSRARYPSGSHGRLAGR